MLLCLCHQQITWHDKLVLLPHSFLRLVMCITLNQSDVPSALTQVYHRCLHLYTPALTHHSLSSLSPAVVTEEGLTPPAHGGHHARQHILTHSCTPTGQRCTIHTSLTATLTHVPSLRKSKGMRVGALFYSHK